MPPLASRYRLEQRRASGYALIDPLLMVPGSGSELTRLFTNLLESAVRHTRPNGPSRFRRRLMRGVLPSRWPIPERGSRRSTCRDSESDFTGPMQLGRPTRAARAWDWLSAGALSRPTGGG